MCFICAEDVEWEEIDWGEQAWIVRPAEVPDAKHICALDVKLKPGQGHDFHTHPNQEEVIFLRSGSVEQWVGQEQRFLSAGDMVFVPEGEVHATFVADDAIEDARLFVVLGPSYGPDGYEAVDRSTEEPWASLRQN